MTEYTIEIYKQDKRMKEGKRFVKAVEVKGVDKKEADKMAFALRKGDPKMITEVHQTWVEVRNIMSGKIVKEHYKTPYSCSVGSESYFSM
jgi:hypothetical protein